MEKKSNLVSLKNNLKKDKIENDIHNIVIEKIMDMPDFQKYKFDVEMIKYVCNLLECLVKKEFKINKKELALNIIGKVFDLNAVEIETIGATIEFLWNNSQIKKVKYLKRITKSTGDWLKKKFL